MSKKSGIGQQMYVHGFDVSGDVGGVPNISSPRPTYEATGIDKSAVERILGPGDGLLDFQGFFNDASVQLHESLKGLPTTDIAVLYAMGSAIGDVCAMLIAKQINYDHSRAPDGSLTNNTQAQGNSVALEWGTMLTSAQDTHSSATSSTSRNDSASSASGAAVVLQVVDIASGTPTVVIEDSANNSSWATLITFSAVADGGEPTAERKTVTGTVDQYLRVTTTGTFTNLDFAIGVRRGESTDDDAY